jgi:hypothetical protein
MRIYFAAAVFVLLGPAFHCSPVFGNGTCGANFRSAGGSAPWSVVNAAGVPSCAYNDVNYCVNTVAEDGDTVLLGIGNATWSDTLTIDKSVILQGMGENRTKIFNNTFVNQSLILISPPSDVPIRINGLYFDLPDEPESVYRMAIVIKGKSDGSFGLTKVRIDHNTFNKGDHQIFWEGWAYGVVDHNVFLNGDTSVMIEGEGPNGGDHSWARPIIPGTIDAVYIESNTFTMDNNYGTKNNNEFIYHQNGGRSVTRYNTFNAVGYTIRTSWFIDSHGNWGGPSDTEFRGQPLREVYRNIFIAYNGSHLDNSRGGSLLFYDNVYTSVLNQSPSILKLTEEDGWTSAAWCPQCPISTTWPAHDQINNTFIWNNTVNGSGNTSIGFDPANPTTDPVFIQEKRDYWLNPPGPTGGKTAYSNDTINETFVEGPNAYYPYVPFVYPHPLTWGDYSNPAKKTLRLSKQVAGNQVTLTWNPVDDATSYKILKNWQEVETVPVGGALAYSDSLPGIETGYIVTAYGNTGALASEGIKVGTGALPSVPRPPSRPRGLKWR